MDKHDDVIENLIDRLCAEFCIAVDNGYNSIHFHELSEEKLSDITQTPYRELKIKFYKKPYINFENITPEDLEKK